MSEYHLRAGRECFVIMPSGIAHLWTTREHLSFTDEDLIFKPGQREFYSDRFKKLPCVQQARAIHLNKQEYYTIFLRGGRLSSETYMLAVHITENDTDDD